MTLRARKWTGDTPFEETLFIEALLGPDRGLWLRFCIDATAGEIELWAMATTPDGMQAGAVERYPLTELGDGVFSCGAARLTPDHTQGELGGVRWDLHLDDRGSRHAHVPWWFSALKVGKAYKPDILDLRVRGEVSVDGKRWPVHSGPGVLGHIWGRRSRVRRWAWAHCNAFDREDLVFEGLSAAIGPVRPLTSLVFLADGHTYRFNQVRHLLGTHTRWNDHRWSFEAHEKGRSLAGVIELDPRTAVTVAYPHGGPDRSSAYCTNTRFGHIRLVLTDPNRGLDLDVRSRECAFELVGPEPVRPPQL